MGGSEQISHCQSRFEHVSKGGQSALAEPCSTHWPHLEDLGKSMVQEVSGTGIGTKFLMQGSGSDTRVGWSGFEFLQIT